MRIVASVKWQPTRRVIWNGSERDCKELCRDLGINYREFLRLSVFVVSPKKIICQLVAQGRRPHAYHYSQRPKAKT
jgi:hypothetical protein